MDTIASMRARQPRFNDTVQLVRSKGTDSLSHFGNGYTHEGGYSLQQNPDEFAALIHLLRERAYRWRSARRAAARPACSTKSCASP